MPKATPTRKQSSKRPSSPARVAPPTRTAKAKQPPNPQRVVAVWATFVGAMTLVGGGLWLGSQRSLGDVPANLNVQPLMAMSSTSSIDSVLRNVQAPLANGRWQAIVIHDSASNAATPQQLDALAKGQGLRGIGYHFVVGNGNGMSDGELHATARWLTQQPGAHTAGQNADWFNRQAIGICLVGDGDRDRFSAAQTRRVLELVDLLRTNLGIPADRVYLHSQVAPTTSPGRYFPEATLRTHLRGG